MKTNQLGHNGINSRNVRMFFVLALVMGMSSAYAADEIGNGMCNLVNILLGKWLFGFTILAMLGGGAVVLFGGEISDGIKKIASIVSIVGMIVGFGQLLSALYSKFGGMSC
jgi:hypothetical protein